MDNFDLKKYLVENRVTKNNQLNEAKTTGQISDEIEELDDIKRRYEEKGDFDRAAKIEDKIENLKSKYANIINKEKSLKEETESVDNMLSKLKESFMPAFEEFVEINLIEKLEDNNNVGYDKLEIDFAKQLKDVLFKLKHGEI